MITPVLSVYHNKRINTLIIITNVVIFSYLMFYYPWQCNRLIIASGGTQSCGLNVEAYLIAIANCVTATAAALLLLQEKELKK